MIMRRGECVRAELRPGRFVQGSGKLCVVHHRGD